MKIKCHLFHHHSSIFHSHHEYAEISVYWATLFHINNIQCEKTLNILFFSAVWLSYIHIHIVLQRNQKRAHLWTYLYRFKTMAQTFFFYEKVRDREKWIHSFLYSDIVESLFSKLYTYYIAVQQSIGYYTCFLCSFLCYCLPCTLFQSFIEPIVQYFNFWSINRN